MSWPNEILMYEKKTPQARKLKRVRDGPGRSESAFQQRFNLLVASLPGLKVHKMCVKRIVIARKDGERHLKRQSIKRVGIESGQNGDKETLEG